jgi:hypothetical protein
MRLRPSSGFAAFSFLVFLSATGCSGGGGSAPIGSSGTPTAPASSAPHATPTPVAATPTPVASPTPTASPLIVNVASVAIALGTTNPPTGTATTIPVLLTITNTAGAVVTGSGTLREPIVLTDSDTSGHTKLSTTTVTLAGTVVTLAYDGSRLVTSATIGATVTGVSAANITAAILTPSSTPGTYVGTSVQTDAFGYPVASPFPTTSVTGTLALTIANGSAANPGGQPATNIHTVESDAVPLSTTTETTDSWLAFSATQTQLFGSVSSDNASPTANTVATAYTTPQIVDMLPETNGATWTNSPAATIAESYADGETADRTVNADGTYTETDTYPNRDPYTFVNTIAVNPDGSGSYTGSGWIPYGIDGLTYTAPVNGIITIDLLEITGPVVFDTVAVWYPATPMSLYNQSNTITTGVAFPASCAVPAGYGTVGNLVAQTTSRVDPVIGYTDGQTIDTYTVPGAGAVCSMMSDATDYYYDYSDDQGEARLGFAPTPLQVSTLTETLTIGSGEPFGLLKRTPNVTASKTTPALSERTVILGMSHFRASVDRQHAKHARAFHSFLLRYLQHRKSQGALLR